MTVIERVNARALDPAALPYAPDLVVADVSFISLTKVLPAVLACAAERFDALSMVKPQFEVGRERVGKGGVVRDPALRREALVARRRAPRGSWAPRVLGFASSRPARARRATGRRSCGWPRAGRAGALDDLEARRRWRSSRDARRDRPHATAARRDTATGARRADRAAAARPASTLRFDAEETRKHGLRRRRRASRSTRRSRDDVDLCVVLGGDGTILTRAARLRGHAACRCSPSTSARSASSPRSTPTGSTRTSTARSRATSRRSSCRRSPSGGRTGTWTAMNDISVHRKPGVRVADLAYALAGEEIGRVRCDGLVVSTPQGSTGYNLANGGPVLAWGVRGLRRLVHRAALADGAVAGRRARRPAHDQQPLARGAGRGPRRRPAGARAASRRGRPRRVRARDARCSRSCRARASTTACASGSAASRGASERVAWGRADHAVIATTAPISCRSARRLRSAGPSGAAGTPSARAGRAARREPPADRAGRAAARPRA